VVTVPGDAGNLVAFLAETAITFGLMLTVLFVSNTPRLERYTGLFAGFLVALYITLEAPLSGMSMNPARTWASAWVADRWTAIWIYFTAPLLGMLAAAQTYLWFKGPAGVFCAKLRHTNRQRCIFCARRAARQPSRRVASGTEVPTEIGPATQHASPQILL
jgi:aquaporin Z